MQIEHDLGLPEFESPRQSEEYAASVMKVFRCEQFQRKPAMLMPLHRSNACQGLSLHQQKYVQQELIRVYAAACSPSLSRSCDQEWWLNAGTLLTCSRTWITRREASQTLWSRWPPLPS